jgi:hypothetical protein
MEREILDERVRRILLDLADEYEARAASLEMADGAVALCKPVVLRAPA